MDNQFNAMSIIESNDIATVSSTLKKISQFQAIVQQTLKKDHDYGIIPGTPKPTLYLPGAQKINMLMQVSPEYEYIDRTVDFDKGFFNYEMRCTLVKNIIQDTVLIKLPVCQGVGSCNSMEKKYRWMNVNESDIPDGIDKNTLKKNTKTYGQKVVTKYQLENDDPYTLANTILKMAKKRALVDATLQLASLAEVFTQDLEDIKDFVVQEQPIPTQSYGNSEQPVISSNNDIGSFVISFGTKHKGKSLNQIFDGGDTNYIQWLADKGTDAEVKSACARFLVSKAKPIAPVVAPKPATPLAKAKDITDASMGYQYMTPPPIDDTQLPFEL